MKKFLVIFLCAALILGALPAGAEGAPWLSPWFSLAENALSGEVPMRGEVRFTVDADVADQWTREAIKQISSMSALADDAYYAQAQIQTIQTANTYFRAFSALMDVTAIELWAENGRYGVRVMVEDHCLADAVIQAEKTEEGVRYALTTDLLPSLVLTATVKGGETADAQGDPRADFLSLLALSKQGDGLAFLRDVIDLERRQAEYFLNGADKVTLTAVEYEALLPGVPLPAEGSLLSVMEKLMIRYMYGDESLMYLFDAKEEGTTYAFEKTAEGCIAREEYTEASIDYVEKADGQGYEKVETTQNIVYAVAFGVDSVVYDISGYVEPMLNWRLSVDASDPDWTRLLYISGTEDNWLNVSRGADGQRVSFGLTGDGRDIKAETNANNAGEAADVSVSLNDGLMALAAKVERAAAGVGKAPDLTGKTEIVFTADENGAYRASDADMAQIKSELYAVARPKLIDFALSKLPKGTEGLTTLLMTIASQIGR